MGKFLPLIQFLPLSIFLAVAKTSGFSHNGWERAFEIGGIVAAIELLLLIPILRNQMNRMIASANLFLMFGAVCFYFEISPFLNLLAQMKESTIFVCVGIVTLTSMAVSESGVFEKKFSKVGAERKLTFLFLIGVAGAFFWSYANRGNFIQAGTLPFISLIILKRVLQRFGSY